MGQGKVVLGEEFDFRNSLLATCEAVCEPATQGRLELKILAGESLSFVFCFKE